jgi:hypothetical protein
VTTGKIKWELYGDRPVKPNTRAEADRRPDAPESQEVAVMLRTKIINMIAIAILSVPAASLAQGRIVPIPHPRIEPPVRFDPFSVKSMHVDVDIDRQVAATTIEQVFHNDSPRDLRFRSFPCG